MGVSSTMSAVRFLPSMHLVGDDIGMTMPTDHARAAPLRAAWPTAALERA
jgi:hypothetical protein